MKILIVLFYILTSFNPYGLAQSSDSNSSEVLPNLNDNGTNTSILNDMLRQTNRRLLALEGGIDINSNTSGILSPSRGGTGQDSSNWPAGDAPIMTALGVWGHQPHFSLYISSGTYTAAATGIIYLTIASHGGNGGAGACGNTGGDPVGGPGGGGSAGSYLSVYPFFVTQSTTYTVTIGAVGSPTSFDVVSVPSGVNGNAASGHTSGTGGVALTGVGTPGGSVYYPYVGMGNGGTNGLGAPSPFGNSGTFSTGAVGTNATGFGAGGGGGDGKTISCPNPGFAGGLGSPAFVMIQS